MKVCLINNLYKPFNRGGAEAVIELTKKGFENRGHEVFVISTRPIFKNIQPEKMLYFLPSLYFYLNKIPKFFRLIWHIWDMFDLVTAWRVKKIIKKEEPDLVITHNLKGLSFLIPATIKGLKIRYFHIIHDIQLIHPSGLMFFRQEKIINTVFARTYQALTRALFSSPQVVVSPSHWNMDLHVEKGFFQHSQKQILPNPLEFGMEAGERRDEQGHNNFLYVGQLEEHKGIVFLVNSFLEALKINKNFKLTIVGGGSLEERVKEIGGRCEQIGLLGRLDKQQVFEEMGRADYLIMPSFCYENSPTVIYEALVCKIGVIASNIGGVGEMAKKFGFRLFEPGNMNDLRDKIIEASKGLPEKVIPEKLESLSIDNYINILENL